MPTKWNKTPQQEFKEAVDNISAEVTGLTTSIAEKYAPQIEAWMKENAIWQDVTGEAREGLTAEVVQAPGGVIIQLSYGGVDHGIFLELSNGGAFAILAPAVDYWFPQMWNELTQEIKKMSYARRANL